MDPNETLRRLAAALRNADRDEAHELVDALVDWIDRGGFVPEALEALR